MRRLLFLVVVTAVGATLARAGNDRPYFPDAGRGAIHQRALDLEGGAVVLALAIQPGYEDLSLLTYLRMALGARPIVVYATNGEATPSDRGGISPAAIAGERKEEAYEALRLLGVQAYFLNLPDPGVVPAALLAQAWNPDTVRSHLAVALASYRPDLVIIHNDFRGDSSRSFRQRGLTELVLDALDSQTPAPDVGAAASQIAWKVGRVLLEDTTSARVVRREYDARHPVWKKSYRAIALEAAAFYQTLRYQLPAELNRTDRTYSEIRPSKNRRAGSIVAGLPTLSKRLSSFDSKIRQALGKNAAGNRTAQLSRVVRAIDTLDYFLARHQSTLTPQEIRIVGSWKNGLEDLRCSLLGVSFGYSVSDSVVTQTQLFTLTFTTYASTTSKISTKIIFPGALEKKWGINESVQHTFDFSVPLDFRILTPRPLDFNTPPSQFGVARQIIRTRFPFLIYHEDSIRSRNFVYRGEILLRSAPRRTLELLTPAIRAIEYEPVVVRLMNVSHDGYRGVLRLSDSLIIPSEKRVFLEKKGSVQVDTLRFLPRRPIPEGGHAVGLSLSGGDDPLTVIAKRIDAATDTAARVAVLASSDESPIVHAIQRLRIPYRLTMTASGLDAALGGTNVLFVDRGVFHDQALLSSAARIGTWIGKGGHLVLLPQPHAEHLNTLLGGLGFRPSPLIPADEMVTVSPGHRLLETPNMLGESDWKGWVISRAMGSLWTPAGFSGEIVARAERGGDPLIVTVRSGNGRITAVAVDLVSQVMNLHPGAHRLLANFLTRTW